MVKTPRYALLINDINDVISDSASEFHSSSQGALSAIPQIEIVLTGIYIQANQPDCLFFDINKLTDVEKQAEKSRLTTGFAKPKITNRCANSFKFLYITSL